LKTFIAGNRESEGRLSGATSYGDLSVAGVFWGAGAMTIKDDLEGSSVAKRRSLPAMG
jgi:hypothetical protein